MDARTGKAIIRPRLLRYFVCLQLQQAGAPLRVRELVEQFEYSPFRVEGRLSKAISDTLRWAVGRGWAYPTGRGMYRPGEIPESTMRYMRITLETARRNGADPAWVNTQRRRGLLTEEPSALSL